MTMTEESGKRAKATEVGGDMIGGLPDELLHHVLSLLPVRDAVRACVLSTRWRHLWVSALRLDIDANYFAGKVSFVKFVNNLLLRRGRAPLDTFWLRAGGWQDIALDDLDDTANLWLRQALRSNVQLLGIVELYKYDYFGGRPATFRLNHHSFTSSHLKRLHIHFVWVNNCLVKQLFSVCPALEDLEMINCDIIATEFSSNRLKNLRIDGLSDQHGAFVRNRIVINMPTLVSLHIGDLMRIMPSLMDVKSLVTASISLDDSFDKWFTFADGWYLLEALSNTKNLELLFPQFECWPWLYLSGSETLRCQVIFTKWTTLSLDEWCLHGGCKALFYMLKHSPNLEKLTLKLYKYSINSHLEWSPNAAAETKTPSEE